MNNPDFQFVHYFADCKLVIINMINYYTYDTF